MNMFSANVFATASFLTLTGGFGAAEHPILDGLPSQTSLLGFWPLDNNARTIDVLNERSPSEYRGTVNFVYAGPSGFNGSSYSWLYVRDDEHALPSGENNNGTSFTIAFYFYPHFSDGNERNGSIFSFYTASNDTANTTINKVQIGARVIAPQNFVLSWNDNDSIYHESSQFVMQENTWTFLAVTFNATDGTLMVSDDSGSIIWTSPNGVRLLSTGTTGGLYIGDFRNSDPYIEGLMRPGDAISCFALYNKTLSPGEISQVARSCSANTTTAVNSSTMAVTKSVSTALKLWTEISTRAPSISTRTSEKQGAKTKISTIVQSIFSSTSAAMVSTNSQADSKPTNPENTVATSSTVNELEGSTSSPSLQENKGKTTLEKAIITTSTRIAAEQKSVPHLFRSMASSLPPKVNMTSFSKVTIPQNQSEIMDLDIRDFLKPNVKRRNSSPSHSRNAISALWNCCFIFAFVLQTISCHI